MADGYFPLCETGHTARTLIETVKRHAEAAGRDPDDLKIEGRIDLVGSPEDRKTALVTWEELGADLVSIGTARSEFHTTDDHIRAIKAFKNIT